MAEFDERDANRPVNDPPMPAAATPRYRRPVLMTVIVMAVAAAGVAIWYGVSSKGSGGDAGGDIPIVRADPEPIRVRPQNPGGMDFPDQDMLVYDRIEGEGVRPQVERLLPPPEAPMELPAPAELAPDAPPPPPPPVVPEPITESAGVKPPLPPPAPKEKADAATPPAGSTPPVTVATTVGDGYKVQLASVRSLETAQGEWSRLSKRHADVLGDFDLDVERADLGARGIFFRVRAGPIANEESAKALCETMKSRDVGCLVVQP
ncbi:MAG: SPOR domain-containing protein [Proteobacteria bacterium]|nr:SPOR domain-containing protein [Pseudomonadota bacterium]